MDSGSITRATSSPIESSLKTPELPTQEATSNPLAKLDVDGDSSKITTAVTLQPLSLPRSNNTGTITKSRTLDDLLKNPTAFGLNRPITGDRAIGEVKIDTNKGFWQSNRFGVGLKNFVMGALGLSAFNAARVAARGEANAPNRSGAFHIQFGGGAHNATRQEAKWANHGSWVGSLSPLSVVGGLLGAIRGGIDRIPVTQFGTGLKSFLVALTGKTAFTAARVAVRGDAFQSNRAGDFHIRFGNKADHANYNRTSVQWANHGAWAGSAWNPLAAIGGALGAITGFIDKAMAKDPDGIVMNDNDTFKKGGDVDTMMNNPTMREAFLEFAERQFVPEVTGFHFEIQDFKANLADPDISDAELQQQARAIYDKFVKESSPLEINVAYDQRKNAIQEFVTGNYTTMSREDLGKVFDEAYIENKKLMLKGPLYNFKVSKQCKEALFRARFG